MSKRTKIYDVGAYVRALRAGATRKQAHEAQAQAVTIAHRPLAPWRAGWKAAPTAPAPKKQTIHASTSTSYAIAREKGETHAMALFKAVAQNGLA